MTKWDYTYQKIKANNLEAQIEVLKQLGNEGWELVLIRNDVDVEGASEALFKRQIE